MIVRFMLIAAVACSIPAAAAAAQNAERECSTPDISVRCNADRQRQIRGLFDAPTLEEHKAAGDEVRRVYFVDDWERPIVLISFVRAPARDPVVRVHYPKQGNGTLGHMETPVSEEVWNRIIFRSAHFDRQLVPRPPRPAQPNIIRLCLHPMTYLAEATDPIELAGDDVRLRRAVETGCERGLVSAFAAEVASAALPLFVPCAALDERHYAGSASQLAACRILSGDRLAAAAVLDRLVAFGRVSRAQDAVLVAQSFVSGVEIIWMGERWNSDGEPEDFWATKMGESDGYFTEHLVEGLSSTRVRALGSIRRVSAGDGCTDEAAAVEMDWAEQPTGFLIERVTVGPWRPTTCEERATQRNE